MKLNCLYEDGHWQAIEHPGAMPNLKTQKISNHPGVPKRWQKEYKKKRKEKKEVNQSGK